MALAQLDVTGRECRVQEISGKDSTSLLSVVELLTSSHEHDHTNWRKSFKNKGRWRRQSHRATWPVMSRLVFTKCWERDFCKWIICFNLDSCLCDSKSGRKTVCSQLGMLLWLQYGLQTKGDCVTHMHEGALTTHIACAAGRALHFISNSPAIQETTWLSCSCLQ